METLQNEMPVKLWETVAYSDMIGRGTQRRSGVVPGEERYIHGHMAKYSGELQETVLVFGPVRARFVINRSGGTLSQGAATKFYTLGSITATAGSTTTLTHAAKFVADEEVGNFVVITDNNDR
jgi:hypothetical protein